MSIEEKITGTLLRDNVISRDETEIVKYGLENLVGNLSGLLITLIIGGYFDFTWGGFLLWLLIFPLRKNAGGFHAETKARCLILSAIVIIMSIACLEEIRWTESAYTWITTISAVVIWETAPVENVNKQLDSIECGVYRKRTRVVLLLETLLFVLSVIFDWNELMIVIAMTFSIMCVVLLTGKGKMLIRRKL